MSGSITVTVIGQRPNGDLICESTLGRIIVDPFVSCAIESDDMHADGAEMIGKQYDMKDYCIGFDVYLPAVFAERQTAAGETGLSARELAIAKIAWHQGYASGHNDTVDGGYNPPDEYDYDQLIDAIQDGVFDDISPNSKANRPPSAGPV